MENKTQLEIKNYMKEKNYKIVSPIPTNKTDKFTYICICNVEKTKAFKEITRVKVGKTRKYLVKFFIYEEYKKL